MTLGWLSMTTLADAVARPLVGAAGAVWGVGLLSDDALEPDRRDLGEEGLTLALDVVEDAHRPELRHRLLEELLSPNERQRPQVKAIQREQVEGVVGGWELDRGALDVDHRREAPALLEPREAWLPLGIEAHDFAVEDAVFERQRLDCTRNFGEDVGVIVAVARE